MYFNFGIRFGDKRGRGKGGLLKKELIKVLFDFIYKVIFLWEDC